MINSITITNHLLESIKLELAFPEESGFAILEVDGLDPPKSNIFLNESSVIDGAEYNWARANPRNVVFKIRFLPTPTVEDVRQKCYKYFPLKKEIKLEIETTNRTVYTYGYVESNEIKIFSDKVQTTISIMCPRPYLYDVNTGLAFFSGVIPLFEFPFSNESLTEKLIEMSSINTTYIKTIDYEGDVTAGMVITVHSYGPASNIRITNIRTLNELLIDSTKLVQLTGDDIHEGDTILISTVPGDKYVTLIRDGLEFNILNTLGLDPDWFYLEKGENLYAYTASSGEENLQFYISYEIAYEGI